MILLGGPVWPAEKTPEAWVTAVKQAGYRAALCPITADADAATRRAYVLAAEKAGIVIAEVGAWSNSLSPDPVERQAAVEKCQQSLALADEVGAVCCVNITGSRGLQWDGPHPDNLTDETFDMIVESTRQIIDAVQPVRTSYALEMMPCAYPDSPESYLKLIQAIDRRALGVHLDPVNIINSPRRYFENGRLIQECVRTLAPYLKTCHAKDIVLRDRLTVHLDEVRPGLGRLAYPTYLRELNRLPQDVPLLVEHLPDPQTYAAAAAHIRHVARDCDIELE